MALTRDRAAVGCTRCILTLADDLRLDLDAEGVCKHCRAFDKAWAAVPKTEAESHALLEPVLRDIKTTGAGKPYDCLIGVSGGVDSTYLALLAKKLGLRPLAVHFDNGWNSELAVINIESMLSKLGIDLITYVIDWDDFRELQIAYLKASVVDIEALTDHAIYGALYDVAASQRIPYILSGVNVTTEHVLPESWNYDKLDFVNIQHIYEAFGSGKPLRNYPFLNYQKLRKIKSSAVEIVPLLDMIPYDINNARSVIQHELDWRPYEGKHFESIFTRFYQGYILPRKFGIDKRRAHLSNLICCGAITRDEALREIQKDIYPADLCEEDKAFVLKKLQLSSEMFECLLAAPARAHRDFDNYRMFFRRHRYLSPLRPIWERFRDRRRMAAE